VAGILNSSSPEEVGSVIWFLWTGHFLPIEIHHQIIEEVYGNSIWEVQRFRKWCRDIQKFRWTSMIMISLVGQAHQGQT